MITHILNIIKFCVHILYPSVCLKCGTYGNALCKICIQYYLQSSIISSDGFYGCSHYSDSVLRSLVITLKQKPSSNIARICAIILYNRIIHIVKAKKITTISVVTLPRTTMNLRKIGHDQMDIIGNELIMLLGKKNYNAYHYNKALINTNTVEHHKLNKIEREQASLSQFVLTTTLPPKNNIIILCDDIITSGSTMRAAHQLFTKAGYANIICASLLIKE